MLLIVCQVKQGWKIIELKRNDMTCEAREKMDKLNRAQKCLILGPMSSPQAKRIHTCAAF